MLPPLLQYDFFTLFKTSCPPLNQVTAFIKSINGSSGFKPNYLACIEVFSYLRPPWTSPASLPLLCLCGFSTSSPRTEEVDPAKPALCLWVSLHFLLPRMLILCWRSPHTPWEASLLISPLVLCPSWPTPGGFALFLDVHYKALLHWLHHFSLILYTFVRMYPLKACVFILCVSLDCLAPGECPKDVVKWILQFRLEEGNSEASKLLILKLMSLQTFHLNLGREKIFKAVFVFPKAATCPSCD